MIEVRGSGYPESLRPSIHRLQTNRETGRRRSPTWIRHAECGLEVALRWIVLSRSQAVLAVGTGAMLVLVGTGDRTGSRIVKQIGPARRTPPESRYPPVLYAN